MFQIILLVAALIVFAILIFLYITRSTVDQPLTFTYENKLSILSGPERAFLSAIEPFLSTNFRIFCKVRLGDIVDIKQKSGTNVPMETLAKINATTVSFVICNADDHTTAGIVDIESRSLNGEEKQMPDDYIDGALAEAGLPSCRISSKLHYEYDYIIARFSRYIDLPEHGGDKDDDNQHGYCPNCGEPLMLLKAKHGENIGKFFVGCTNYPECKYLSPLDEGQTLPDTTVAPPLDSNSEITPSTEEPT